MVLNCFRELQNMELKMFNKKPFHVDLPAPGSTPTSPPKWLMGTEEPIPRAFVKCGYQVPVQAVDKQDNGKVMTLL